MYCYDCSRRGRPEIAVGVCAACGAAVCANCARVGRQTVRRMEGFVQSDQSNIETRIVNCGPCADAVHAHHPAEQGLARQGSR